VTSALPAAAPQARLACCTSGRWWCRPRSTSSADVAPPGVVPPTRCVIDAAGVHLTGGSFGEIPVAGIEQPVRALHDWDQRARGRAWL